MGGVRGVQEFRSSGVQKFKSLRVQELIRGPFGPCRAGAGGKCESGPPPFLGQGKRKAGPTRKRKCARRRQPPLQGWEKAKRARFIVPLQRASIMGPVATVRPVGMAGPWKTLGIGGRITGAEAGVLAWGQSSRGPVLSFRYTSGGQRAAKVAPNHPRNRGAEPDYPM